MALWYTEMKRNLKRFKEVRKEIEVGKMSGAVGTFANILLKLKVTFVNISELTQPCINSNTST